MSRTPSPGWAATANGITATMPKINGRAVARDNWARSRRSRGSAGRCGRFVIPTAIAAPSRTVPWSRPPGASGTTRGESRRRKPPRGAVSGLLFGRTRPGGKPVD
ncbi:hypothetical protein GCM10027160_36430 [Streptomyces calidiresistens]